MSTTPDSTLPNPERLVANLERRLAEHEAELTQALDQLATVTFNSGTFNDACQITATSEAAASCSKPLQARALQPRFGCSEEFAVTHRRTGFHFQLSVFSHSMRSVRTADNWSRTWN